MQSTPKIIDTGAINVDELAARESETILRGVHPKPLDPDQVINRALAEHQAGLTDWKVLGDFDLAREHRRAMQWVEWLLLEDDLIPRVWKGIRVELPQHLRITFEPVTPRRLGSYHFGRSVADGLRWRINLNPHSILRYRRSPAQTASVLLHEMLHLVQDAHLQAINKPPSRSSYHGVEFCRHAEGLGIPCTKNGAERGITEDGRFQKWLTRRGIPGEFEYDIGEVRAPSRLAKRIAWRCSCDEAVSVMVPRASVIQAVCQICERVFTPASLDESMRDGRLRAQITRH